MNNPTNQEGLQEVLRSIAKHQGPEREAALREVLTKLRDYVLISALFLADDPKEFERFLNGMDQLANSIGSLQSHNRPIHDSITQIREAAAKLGFGKFINRDGKQESPED